MQFNLIDTKITNDELLQLHQILKSDPTNQDIKDKIIIGFISIASNIALAYHRRTRFEFDILQSEAILAVVKAVNKLPALNHNNPGGFINIKIHGSCIDYIRRVNKYKTITLIKDIEDSYFDLIEFKDSINYIVHNDRERQIIVLRIEGKTDTEIGKILGYSPQTISKIRSNLFQRFRRLTSE